MDEYILNSKENINIINNKQIPKEIDRWKNYILRFIKYSKLKNIDAELYDVIEKNINFKKEKNFYVHSLEINNPNKNRVI